MEYATDEEILARISRGDRSAQREFYILHREAAYRAAYRLLGNDADALDATSESFIKAFRSARTFRGRSSVRTWFYRIVINSSLDIRRHTHRAVSLEAGEEDSTSLADTVPSEEETPAQKSQRGELAAKIADAISRLDDKHRTVFVLAVVQELSYKEVAGILGISIGTVMSRLFYARKYLQRSLGRYVGT